MPAATNEVATQKSASWTCQVRIRLNGMIRAEVEAEEVGEVGAVVLRGGPDEGLDQEEAAIDKKNQAVARWAGVKATSPSA